MKKIITLIVLLLLIEHTYSQKITVKWSKEFLDEKGEHFGSLIHYDGTYSYFNVGVLRNPYATVSLLFGINSDERKITPGIIKFDGDLKQVKRQDYKVMKSEDKELYYHGMYYLDRSFIMLTSRYEKRTNTRELFGQKINYESLATEGSAVTILKVSAEKGEDFGFNIGTSEDSAKLIVVVNPDQKKKKPERFAFKIVDNNFKMISEKSVELPYNDEDFNVISTRVNSKGQLFLLAKAYESGGSKKESVRNEEGKKVASYEIVLKRFSPDGSVKDFNLDLGGKFLGDFKMELNQKGDLFIAGLFKEEDKDYVQGYFYFHLDSETGNKVSSNTYQFPLPLITRVNDLENDKTAKKFPGISHFFVVSDLILTDDQRVYLILEKDYRYQVNMSTISYPVFVSNGMIAFQLDIQGKQKWNQYIPKQQFYNDITAYQYHTYMVFKDRLTLFYNDSKDNLDYSLSSQKPPKRFNEMKEMSLMSITLDANGKMTRKEFSNSEKMGTLPYISLSSQISDKKFLLYGFKYKKKGLTYDVNAGTNKLGILTFE